MHFQNEDETVTFYKGPIWFWPFGALPLGPHGGHTYYLNNFESPTPKDDYCQVWLKSNHAFSRRR